MMIFHILLIGLAVVVLIQLVYYILIFGRFSFLKKENYVPKNIPISVIVCAKNEVENIKQFFPLLIRQNYPNFEIVLIDNASNDETRDLFEEYEQQYSNVKIVKVDNNEAFWGNKKYALTLGIKAAKNEYLLFTDANCYPKSKDWISIMCSQFTQQKTIVLGYSSYEKIKNSFLNKIIRFDNTLTATQYFAWAKIGKAYMGVGKNLAYKKEEFFKVRGFMDHMKVRFGDDDLFINQASTPKNTTICYNSESFTYSKPKKTLKEWLDLKKQHLITSKLYTAFDKFQLALFTTSQLLFILLSALLLAFQFQWIIVLGLLLFRYLFSWITIGYAASKLNEKDVIYWYPFIEIILIFMQFYIYITSLFTKK